MFQRPLVSDWLFVRNAVRSTRADTQRFLEQRSIRGGIRMLGDALGGFRRLTTGRAEL